MQIYDILSKKKRGEELTKEEICFFVDGFTNGNIPDYQMSALLMAICINGMTGEEVYHLTIAMRDSGEIINLSQITGIKVDKHSTGGVGDKITLVLSPVLACLGAKVAKMSGRGLGHTGGTIDKLESIDGFSTSLSTERFIESVNQIGLALVGQTEGIAPADKKMYALRDVTATVDCIPLIASSVMSKKLAAGADCIVLDVKCGNGAFMKDVEQATDLAKAMIDIGKRASKKVTCIISDMNQPLGCYIGNGLEVIETIECLKGNGPSDIIEIVHAIGKYMLIYAGIADNEASAINMIDEAIKSGVAYDKFVEFVKNQGGDATCLTDYKRLSDATIIKDVSLNQDGYIKAIETEMIGKAVRHLGGGRYKKDDVIDLDVGIVMHKKIGDKISKSDIAFTIYGNDEKKVSEVTKMLVDSAFEVSDEKVSKSNIIKNILN